MKCNNPNCILHGKKKGSIDHLGICHDCPHWEDKSLANLPRMTPELFETYKEEGLPIPSKYHPCSCCIDAKCDSRNQGHGRGYSYETVPPDVVSEKEYDMPAIFEDEQPPSIQEQLRAIFHSLVRLTPREYVSFIEYIRPDPKTGIPRNLEKVAEVVNDIFNHRCQKCGHKKQADSFQLVDMHVESAKKKLAQGANFAAAALKMQGGG